MMRQEKRLLLHPFFLISLLLLILNDHYFKYQYPGWVTGKLSDFTGLLVWVVFWTALFPLMKMQVYVLTVIWFVWWKSPLSEGGIAFFSETLSVHLQRTVDFTDLIAFCMLPLAWRLKPVSRPVAVWNQAGLFASGLFAFLAICATSAPLRKSMVDNRYYTEGKASRSFMVRGDEVSVVNSLEANGYKVTRDSAFYKPRYNRYFTKEKDSLGRVYMKDWSKQYPRIYTKAEYGKAFTLDRLVVKGDTIENIQFMLAENWGFNNNKAMLELVSFQYKADADSGFRFPHVSPPYEYFAPKLKRYFRRAAKR